jgi:hypothetical protein
MSAPSIRWLRLDWPYWPTLVKLCASSWSICWEPGISESMFKGKTNLIQTCSLRLSFSPVWTSFIYVKVISMGFTIYTLPAQPEEKTSWMRDHSSYNKLFSHPIPLYNRRKSTMPYNLIKAIPRVTAARRRASNCCRGVVVGRWLNSKDST